MYCVKCGKQIDDGSTFCEFCGAKQDEMPETTKEPVQQVPIAERIKALPKNVIGIAAGVVVLIVVILIVVSVTNSASSKLNKALKSGDIDEAADIYEDYYEDKDKDIPAKSLELLKSGLTQIQTDYTAGNLTTEEALEALEDYEAFVDAGIKDEYETLYASLTEAVEYETYIANGDSYDEYMDEGDSTYYYYYYSSAYSAYYSALEIANENELLDGSEAKAGLQKIKDYMVDLADTYLEDENYSSAYSCVEALTLTKYFEDDTELTTYLDDVLQAQEEAEAARAQAEEEAKIADMLSYADEYYDSGWYTDAYDEYNYILEQYPDSEEAAEGAEKSLNAYRDSLLDTAQNYLDNQDYDSARSTINNGLNGYLSNDSELLAFLDTIDDTYVDDIIDEANDMADANNWDGALALLEEAENTYSSDEFTSTYEALKEAMPITLANVTMVSSDKVSTLTGVVTDRYGNIYDGAVKYDTSDYDTAFGLYNLNKKYSTFTGTMFVSKDSRNDRSITVSIYADETLMKQYYYEDITEETAPIEFSIDVTNVSTLRIECVDENGTWNTSELLFGDTSFVKVSDSGSDDADEEETEEETEEDDEDTDEDEEEEE